ncbi:hypothetical protein KUCAC02_017090 [Chaenocephalus aceratus]|uniref:Uncharacterized protein n=1 Tax=Chaenocephalus aceratus TaxID=36190 RepID=A0ACB9VZX6_CHAAC|nr:hypothetical protein KUCAC02_017090 [Chaenocephalus aceratus]
MERGWIPPVCPWMVTSERVLPKAPREEDASSCVKAPYTHPLPRAHFRDVFVLSSITLGPTGATDLQTSIWPDP